MSDHCAKRIILLVPIYICLQICLIGLCQSHTRLKLGDTFLGFFKFSLLIFLPYGQVKNLKEGPCWKRTHAASIVSILLCHIITSTSIDNNSAISEMARWQRPMPIINGHHNWCYARKIPDLSNMYFCTTPIPMDFFVYLIQHQCNTNVIVNIGS